MLFVESRSERAVALVVVLAFVVLLTGVVVAYFSAVSAERTLSSGSSRQAEADQCARGALSAITGDLKLELSASLPVTAANIEPRRTEFRAPGVNPMPNLIRRSRESDPTSRASAVNSAANPSLNGRSISLSRWNKHYLLPRPAGARDTDTTPDPAAGFTAPDWVFVTDEGPKPIVSPDQSVFGRYAYAIYDEGGLIDVNVAGYPFALAREEAGSKGPIALADLTVIGITSTAATKHVDRLVGWRTYASTEPTIDRSGSGFPKFEFNAASVGRFRDYVLNETRTFTSVEPVTASGRTDQLFTSRQQLLAFRSSTRFSVEALQYVGTFSRGRIKPTWTDSGTRLSGRFPLSRFNLFEAPAANAAQITRYFGLEYIPGPPERWRYIGEAGSAGSALSSIAVLVGNGQDPDLSVLLKYALPAASTADILSMMASMIDLRDTNDATTWIEYSSSGTPPVPLKAFGGDRTASSEPGAPAPPAAINDFKRPFRNAGELGYALKNGTTSVNMATAGAEAPLLDLFTFSTAPLRAGLINLNTHNSMALACLIGRAYEVAAKWNSGASADYTGVAKAKTLADDLVAASSVAPGTSRADIGAFTAAAGTGTEDAREVIGRSLSEATQTQTWNLMIDVIAQSGRYPSTVTAGDLAKFVVQGEKRYWLHIAIDRLTGEVIDQQLEAVYE